MGNLSPKEDGSITVVRLFYLSDGKGLTKEEIWSKQYHQKISVLICMEKCDADCSCTLIICDSREN